MLVDIKSNLEVVLFRAVMVAGGLREQIASFILWSSERVIASSLKLTYMISRSTPPKKNKKKTTTTKNCNDLNGIGTVPVEFV